MKSAWLIGVGSPFSNDVLGWQVVDALKDHNITVEGWQVNYAKTNRPASALIEYLEKADMCFILDALENQPMTQTSAVFLTADQLQGLSSCHSSHALGVAEALVLAEKLGSYTRQPKIIGLPFTCEPNQRIIEQIQHFVCQTLSEEANK